MIPRTATLLHKNDWKSALRNTINTPQQLAQAISLSQEAYKGLMHATELFPLKIPISVLSRIQENHLDDPVLRQYLPTEKEMQEHPDYQIDPVGDLNASPLPGIIHKYQSRALIITSQVCAVHCRYCFRRHFPYQDMQLTSKHQEKIIAYLRENPALNEIILSGGDPLSLDDEKLYELIQALESVSHIKTLRIHSRLPIVIPSRVTDRLLDILKNSRFKTVMVLHCNHANEIDEDVESACLKLKQHTDALLNQSVLLRSINDSADVLAELSYRLFDCGVIPYYLHLFDKVQNAAHFDISAKQATIIVDNLRKKLPGYLVPKLVTEIAGEPCKTPVE